MLGMILLYVIARAVEIAPSPVSQRAVVALDVMSALNFALLHGTRHYRLRGILIFAGISLAVGNLIENLGVATGFPFGHYYFATLMGPKLFQVPVMLGMAYVGMAYVSWMLARLIVGNPQAPLTKSRILTLPLVASFIMVAWDLAQDPVWATALHGWVWRDGGPWFGVPVTNFLGWYLNVFIIYLLFALYVRSHPVETIPDEDANWWPPLLFYGICALGNVLQTIHRAVPEFEADPTGKMWRVADITAASTVVSVFVMGAFLVFASVRLAEMGKRSEREAAD
jgi:putative membrane protein